MTVYSRFTCPICERWYQARSGAMFAVKTFDETPTVICFMCARKLIRLKLIRKEQLPEGDPNVKRIVEI